MQISDARLAGHEVSGSGEQTSIVSSKSIRESLWLKSTIQALLARLVEKLFPGKTGQSCLSALLYRRNGKSCCPRYQR